MNSRRLKLGAVLAGVVLSAFVLLTWTREWYAIRLDTGQVLSVAGDVAAPALTALALSGFALAAALAIAGVVFRVILGLLQASLGALIITSAALAMADPVTASARAITQATGVDGRVSIGELVDSVAGTAWPAVALALGILLTLLGAAIVFTARRWPDASRKYRTLARGDDETERSAIGDWDALSDGRDPSL